MVHVVSKIPIIQYHIEVSKILIERKILMILNQLKVFNDVYDMVETWSGLICDIVEKHLSLEQYHAKRK